MKIAQKTATNSKTKMQWENLPIEIRTYILSFRYTFRNNGAKKIQNAWNKYLIREATAIDIALNLEVDTDGLIMISTPETSRILKMCNKIVKGDYNKTFWLGLIENIKIGLYLEEYRGGPLAIYYNKIEKEWIDLEKKFT